MHDYLNIITLPLFLSLIITLALFIYSFPRRSRKGAPPFLLSLISIFIWTAGYIFEIGSQDLNIKLFWANLQFFGIGMLPVTWFITTLCLTGRGDSYKTFLPFLLPIPLLINLLIWTNPLHQLIRRSPELLRLGPLLLIDAHYGALHSWIFVPFQYIIYGFTLVLFLDAWTNARPLYKHRYLLIGNAILIPMVGSALYIIGIEPFKYINLTPALFSITCIIFARAIFSFSMFDILPLARDTVLENIKDSILVFDGEDRLVDYNPSAEDLFHSLRPEQIGDIGTDVLSSYPMLVNQLLGTAKQNDPHTSLQFKSKDDHHYRSSLSLVKNKKGRLIGKILNISDITSQMNLLKKMQQLATTDSLTGILNRRSFFERSNKEIDRAKRYQRPVSFILLDIDHFKRINDSCGHAAGDAVLTELSRRISDTIRKEDIFGRYGGEEFSLCLPETKQSTAYIFAERLRQIVEEEPVSYKQQKISATASFGVVGVETVRDENLDDLLLRVDKAMYDAKELGRNRCEIYSPQLYL